jgi:integrase
MIRTLHRIDARLPDVLRAPGNASGERVMAEAIAALANPKVEPTLRLAALSELQARMRTIDPKTPQRLFLLPPEQRSSVAATLSGDLADLARFDAALERYVLGRKWSRAVDAAAALAPQESAGLVLALLVTRLGQASLSVAGRVLAALAAGARPFVAGRWVWLDIELYTTGRAQLRRIFLDPATLAAWQLAAVSARSLERPPAGYKAGRKRAFWRQAAGRCFRALCRKLDAAGQDTAVRELTRLCACEAQRLRVTTLPVLATYAEGQLSSSSLEIGTWCRIIGFEQPRQAEIEAEAREDTADVLDEADDTAAGAAPVRLDGIAPDAVRDWGEQLAEGDLERVCVSSDLRRITAEPRAGWNSRIAQLAERLNAEGASHQAEELVVRWLGYLAGERQPKGRRLSDGTIRYYRGLVANRLLQVLPPSLSGLTADELEDAYAEVILSRSSPPQTARIQAALASFDRFVRERHLPELPRVALAGFGGGSYAISSRILIEAEFQMGLDLIESGAVVSSDDTSAFDLRAFWILAYRFGLRRTEILGLQRRDFARNTLTVRANAARSLKTVNARRVLPLSALPGGEQAGIDFWFEMKAENTYCFFDHEPSARELESHPVIARAKELLGAVSGDRRLHVHNLRHSTATLHLLGILGSDLGLGHHPYCELWMKEALAQAGCVDAEISGALYRRGGRGNALAMMMGHGSEATTYEHYVHSFDLLLFIACWSGRFRPASGQRSRGLYPPREERSLLLALMGLARTTQVETGDVPTLLARIAALAPGSLEVLRAREALSAPDAEGSVGARGVGQGSAALLRWSLADWIELARADGAAAALLQRQSDRHSVAALWQQFKAALAARPDELAELLRAWVNSRGVDGGWASIAPSDAREWVRRLRALTPGVAIEAFRAWKDDARRNVKSPVMSLTDAGDIEEMPGRYYLRFADVRPKRNHRRSVRHRSSSQRSITWFVVELEEQIRLMQAEKSVPSK